MKHLYKVELWLVNTGVTGGTATIPISVVADCSKDAIATAVEYYNENRHRLEREYLTKASASSAIKCEYISSVDVIEGVE